MNTIIVLLVISILVAGLAESSKHLFFKNEAKKWQMYPITMVLSAGLSAIGYYGFNLMGEPIAIVIYALIVWIVQKEVNMKIIRPKIKSFIEKSVDKLETK